MTIEAVIPFAKENGVIIAIENVWNIDGNFIKENKEKFYENF